MNKESHALFPNWRYFLKNIVQRLGWKIDEIQKPILEKKEQQLFLEGSKKSMAKHISRYF